MIKGKKRQYQVILYGIPYNYYLIDIVMDISRTI